MEKKMECLVAVNEECLEKKMCKLEGKFKWIFLLVPVNDVTDFYNTH